MITICLLSIELDILQNSIWDICSSYTGIGVRLGSWAVSRPSGWAGFSNNSSLLYLINHKGKDVEP